MKKSRKKKLLWGTSLLIMIILMISILGIYVSDYYPADKEAIAAFAYSNTIDIEQTSDRVIAYIPEDPTAGFIFYPGGKVEHTAYEPLMLACAEKGILCILTEMPFHLAVLDINAAAGIQERFPEIQNWYIGGHSLGGSMAASYLGSNTTDFDGLILLGSYSTADFSETDLSVLSIYGSEDHILNMDKYKEYKSNLPSDFSELVIDGGCHAYFGMYGEQDFDGIPSIQNTEQIQITAGEIAAFITTE